METLGQFLKREREFRGILIEDLSRSTKINVRFLQLIEGDHWDQLPTGAFVRGFLKVFANTLGLPLDEVLRRYEQQIPVVTKAEDPFKKFRGFDVKNQFFVFLLAAVLAIVLAAYLSSR